MQAMTQQRATGAQERASNEPLRRLLCDTRRLVTGPGQGPSTRKAAIVPLHDLGRNIANAYHWHHLLLAVCRDGDAPATAWAIKECIRAINDGAPAKQPKPRRAAEIQRAWDGRTPALVM